MRLLQLPLLLLLPIASAQYYTISTVAGSGQLRYSGNGPALSARLVNPRFVAAGLDGAVFLSDTYFHQVFQISASGAITLIAGTGQPGFSGDDGPATAARLDTPSGLAVDNAGNLYIADQGNARIRRVTPAGIITTFAGNGRGGATGDGGPALEAALGNPSYITLDGPGNLFISQPSAHVIRRITPQGIVSTIAGSGTAGFSGDGGPATSANLFTPQGLRVDFSGNLYFADSQNNRIRRVTPQGVISTVAGNGTGRYAGDNGPATQASLAIPSDVALDANNILHIADTSTGRVRQVSSTGIITSVAGGGASFTDGPSAQAMLPGLNSIAFDTRGGLVMAIYAVRQIRRAAQQTITTIAGVLPTPNFGDNQPATSATLLGPIGVAVDPTGNLLVSDQIDHRVRRVSSQGNINTAAGTGIFGSDGNGAPATAAAVGAPRGLAYDLNGNLLIASGGGAVIRRVAPNGTIASIAGGGGAGFGGDGGPATAALLFNPIGVTADAGGNVFVSDSANQRIRRIDAASQTISTIAGTGTAGYSGDGGAANGSQIVLPRQIATGPDGSIYFADTGNHRIRRITPQGLISTVAGNGGSGVSGDGGPATAAQVASPSGLAIDPAGNLFIAHANVIRKVDAATGIISRIAGAGPAGFSGDGALATNATLDSPFFLALDSTGALYFSDTGNYRVRKLTPARIVSEGVTNGGSLRTGPVAPGEIISIFGFDLGPASGAGLQLGPDGLVANSLAGTQVFFDDVPAPLLYVSAGQVNAVVPYAVAGKATTQLRVNYLNRPTNTITLPVAPSSPGVFAITNQNGSVNASNNPAAPGSVLIVYGTGEGQTSPAGIDGSVANSVFPKPVLDVSVTLGGQPVQVLYAGAAPGFVAGVLQMNLQLPPGRTGTLPLVIKIGEATTPSGLNVTVR